MNLLQVTVELRHAEPLKLFRPYAELYTALTDKALPEKETALPGFELNIAEKKILIVVDPKRTAIVLGDIPNTGYCVDNIMAVIKKIGELVKVPPLQRLGIRSLRIMELETSFEELVTLYKDLFYKTNTLIEQTVDVGTAFTLTDNEYRINLSFGPMELSQLETRLRFKPSSLPKVSTFVDVDYFLTMDKKEVTDNSIREFISRGLNYSEELSQTVTNIFQGEE